MDISSIMIDANELSFDRSDNKYNIATETFLQLYNFYADGNHEQGKLYIIDSASYEFQRNVITAEVGTFNSVGIWFDDDKINYNLNYILFISEQDLESVEALKQLVQQESTKYGCTGFRYAVIEKAYSNSNARKRDNEILRQVLPNVVVFNRDFPVIEHVEHKVVLEEGHHYFDLSSLFNRYFFCTTDTTTNINNIYKICDELISTLGEYDRYYLDISKLTEYSNTREEEYIYVYYSLAAYLSVFYHFNFDLDAYGEKHMLDLIKSLSFKSNNFLDDYINFVKNPLDAGLIHRNGELYFCFKDRQKMQENPKAYLNRIAMVEIDYKDIDGIIRSTAVTRKSYILDDIEVLSLEGRYGLLSKDWDTAYAGFLKLDSMLTKFEKILQSTISFSECDPPRVSNVLLYRVDGVEKLGYVTEISGSTLYKCTPVDPRYSFFNCKLDISEYPSILSKDVFFDGDRYFTAFKKAGFISGNNISYAYPEHCRGIIISSMRIDEAKMNPQNDKISLAEMGLWNPVSAQFKNSKAQMINAYFNVGAAREIGLLTYFGGPFPEKSRNFVIKQEYWR